MTNTLKIGIIGDFEPDRPSHVATNEALTLAGQALGRPVQVVWLPTPSLLTGEGLVKLSEMDGLWASPGSPYKSMDGALAAIQFARQQGKPFIGT